MNQMNPGMAGRLRAPARNATPVPQKKAGRRDPAPSKLTYRFNRMMLRPAVRRLIRIGIPASVAVVVAGFWLTQPENQAYIAGHIDVMTDKLQNNDRFLIKKVTIQGASEPILQKLAALLPGEMPISKFDLDLAQIEAEISKLDAIASADLGILADGVLALTVTERVPVMIWRNADGLQLLDKTGHRVDAIASRDLRGDLPIIAGEGADIAASEAVVLFAAAYPLREKLRGMERIGERRWDMVLEKGQRIMLPEEGAPKALEWVLAMDRSQDLLRRDVIAVDLRNGLQPILNVGNDGMNALRRARGQDEIGLDGKVIKAKPVATKKN